MNALAGFAGLLIAPALFWGAFHYYKDRHQPEPVANLMLIYDVFALRADAWARVLPPAIVLSVYVWRMVLLRRLNSDSSGKRSACDGPAPPQGG